MVGRRRGGSGVVATFQNLVKPFIGAGILALPASFRQGGLLASIVLMATMAAMANYCIRCLLHCLHTATQPGYLSPRHKRALDDSSAAALLSPLVDSSTSSLGHPSLNRLTFSFDGASYSPASPPTFRDIGELAFGSWGKFAVDLSLIASQLGFCTAYVAFIGDNMNAVVPDIPSHHWMLLTMSALIVLCQIRQVATIAFTSAIGNAVYLVSIIIIAIDGVRQREARVTELAYPYLHLPGLPLVFGTACFALEGIGLILPVKAAMREADQSRFYFLLNVAVALVATAYIAFGSLGYLFYGDAVVAPVTGNLTPGIASDAVRVSLCISLFFSYILQLFPVVDISDYAVYCAMRSAEEAEMDGQRERAGPATEDTEDRRKGRADTQHGGEEAERETDPEGEYEEEEVDSKTSHRAGANGGAGGGGSGLVSVGSSLSVPMLGPSPPSLGRLSPSSPFASPRTPHLTVGMVAVQCLVRAGCVGLTALVAIVVSNFGFVVSLTGSLANSLIAFILPALFYIRLVVIPQHPRPWAGGWADIRHFILPTTVVVSGICASIVGVYSAISDEITAK